MIRTWQIEKGPRRGMWAWQIQAPQKPVRSQWKAYGRRRGVAIDETRARATAVRQLNWHRGEQP